MIMYYRLSLLLRVSYTFGSNVVEVVDCGILCAVPTSKRDCKPPPQPKRECQQKPKKAQYSFVPRLFVLRLLSGGALSRRSLFKGFCPACVL